MKAIAGAVLSLTLATSSFGAKTPIATLESHVAKCPIIVVGHISSVTGFLGEGAWEGKLAVTAALKGSPPNPLNLFWLPNHVRGFNPNPSIETASDDKIWLLRRHSSDGRDLTAYEFNDPRLSLDMRNQVETIIRNQILAAGGAACEAKGGKVQGVGSGEIPWCVTPFADGGKECKDSAECIAGCFYTGKRVLPKGTAAKGACRKDNNPYGCFVEIKNGKTENRRCKDT